MKITKKKSLGRTRQLRPHPVDIRVGKRIRHFRHLRGMSQTDLAEQIGVRFQQVQKYEKASNRISASRLKMAAETLNVSIKDLFWE